MVVSKKSTSSAVPSGSSTPAIDIKAVLKAKKPLIDAAIEKYLPRAYDAASLEMTGGKPRYAYDAFTATKALAEPVWDLLDRGGKRWRPALFLMVAEAIAGPAKAKDLIDFVVIPEVVHNGTLMVDDIEDGSELRRGKPCTHKIFGVDIAVNAGNFMYYAPLLPLMKHKGKFSQAQVIGAYETYAQEMINVSLGQGFDIYWHNHAEHAVSEAQYLQMCAFKTGTLARMSAKIAAILAGADDKTVLAAGKFAECLGVGFQIQDDVLNLVGEEFGKGKGVGEDIHEGKQTLMVIHALSKLPPGDAKRLKTILSMHTFEQPLIDEAIRLLQKAGSIEYAKTRAATIVKDAWDEFAPLLKPSTAKDELHALAAYAFQRQI